MVMEWVFIMVNNNWKLELNEYIRQGGPDKVDKSSTAVFIVKYLKTFGFNISNETFAENSWYFRNALVRANYNDWQNGIHETTKFLEMFFENLLMSAGHELKNRYMHIDYENQSAIQSENTSISKCNNCTLEELAIINEEKD